MGLAACLLARLAPWVVVRYDEGLRASHAGPEPQPAGCSRRWTCQMPACGSGDTASCLPPWACQLSSPRPSLPFAHRTHPCSKTPALDSCGTCGLIFSSLLAYAGPRMMCRSSLVAAVAVLVLISAPLVGEPLESGASTCMQCCVPGHHVHSASAAACLVQVVCGSVGGARRAPCVLHPGPQPATALALM